MKLAVPSPWWALPRWGGGGRALTFGAVVVLVRLVHPEAGIREDGEAAIWSEASCGNCDGRKLNRFVLPYFRSLHVDGSARDENEGGDGDAGIRVPAILDRDQGGWPSPAKRTRAG